MLGSYGHPALLTYPEIAREVTGMMQAGAGARNICDTVAANYGVEITAKQLANLKRDRLGGQAAVSNLSLLLQRFASFSGSRCLVVDDQNGDMCAVVMQSAAQREMFELYGDNLILDRTHNTNNIGFYLGTSPILAICEETRGSDSNCVYAWHREPYGDECYGAGCLRLRFFVHRAN
jgi:hypothetical protein